MMLMSKKSPCSIVDNFVSAPELIIDYSSENKSILDLELGDRHSGVLVDNDSDGSGDEVLM